MRPQRSTSISTFAMVVTLGVSSVWMLSASDWKVVQAQESTTATTTVRIKNLTRMAPINQALKQRYETQFPDAIVDVKTQQTDASLQLQNEQADLAAISRLLTAEEKAQGLVQVPVTREKIAIVVGQDNPFAKGLTIDQVVKIFRGEITDWSQLGGRPAPIRVIHRPIASNLQSTLQTYALFREANFEAGGKIVQLDQDSVSALTNELGTDGISYTLASQLGEVDSIRPISMYNTLPDDPRYPFSQPFTYVYQGTPSASTKTFLDFVASVPGQEAIAEAKTQPAAFNDSDATSSSTNDSSDSSDTKASNNPGSPDNTQSANPSSATSDSSSTTASSADTTDSGSSTVASRSTDAAGEAQDGSGGLGWLPIALVVLVLGGVIGGVIKTLLAKSKPKTAPRPAPNYAEKIRPTHIQGMATQLQDPPDSPSSTPATGGEGSRPLPSENMALGAAAADVANDVATPAETEPQSSEWVDITSKELQAQTRIQNPKTELQDTPPPLRGPKTQLQDPIATQLQVPDSEDNPEASPVQPLDSSPTQLQDPIVTQLQESSPTQLQDSSVTQLQDPSPTQLQDPSPTQLQESSPTQLQDTQQTWVQDPESPVDVDSNPTQLQDPGLTQLQDPTQTWIQDEELSQTTASGPTQLQDPSATQMPDPKQTWIQSEEFPEGMDPRSTQSQDPKQTWIQEDEG